MNLLPHESLDAVLNPAGLRLGVQEMTRFGMKEDDMARIADFFKSCLMDGRFIAKEVAAFRSEFVHVHYSFDPEGEPAIGFSADGDVAPVRSRNRIVTNQDTRSRGHGRGL